MLEIAGAGFFRDQSTLSSLKDSGNTEQASMTLQFSNSINEELIAAYVDGDVSAEERQRVEAAMAVNEQIAWEVNTLRQTVELLHDMPRVALPRSFVLTEDQVKDVVQARRSHARVSPAVEVEAPAESPWERLLNYLNGGNPVFRNAAALAVVLLLLVVLAEIPLHQSQVSSPPALNGQLSGASSSPQIQVTVVGEPFSRMAGAESNEPATGEQVVDSEENVTAMEGTSDQESGETSTGFDVMSTGEGDTATVVPTPQPVVKAEEQPAITAAPTTARSAQEESIPTPSTGGSNAPVEFDRESEESSRSSLLTLLAYARNLLIVAVIVFWLLSRFIPRSNRAGTAGS